MYQKNYYTESAKTRLMLDKNARKAYNEKKGSIFDEDDIADSALSYLYNDANKIKTQSFLKSNGFPTLQQRAQNQQLYGAAQEQKQIRDLLKSTANNTLNPNVTKLDHGFLQGIYGDEEGDREYQKMLADASLRQRDMYNAFQGSPFESMLNPSAPVSGYVQNRTLSATERSVLDPLREHNTTQYFDTKTIPSTTTKSTKSNVGKSYTSGAAESSTILKTGEAVAKELNDLYKQAKQAFQTAGGYINEAQKYVQRSIWKTGAQKLLRDEWKYETSAWMLEHALQDNPSDIWRGNDSRIAYLINNDSVYLSKLDEAIKNSKDGTIDEDLSDVQFNKKDLYYSIHKATIHVTGYKQNDGKWIVHATLSDIYDFTEIMTFMDDDGGWSTEASLGTVANDAAAISQLLGAINPYKVHVEFFTTR